MNLVFADAFYYVARLNRRDQYHEQVVAFSRSFHANLLTTDLILLEVADALAKSECRPRIHDFMSRLRDSKTTEVIPASRDLLDRGLELYNQHQDKEWSLTDCTSMVVMRERGISLALTGDKHFEQAGFTALLK
jgi:predicted nucleic acid-binding protein